MTDPTRTNTITGLRKLADFLEANPEFESPSNLTVNIFPANKDEYLTHVRMLGIGQKRSLGDDAHDWVCFKRDFGGNVSIEVNLQHRDLCERVVVGTEEQEVEEYDAELLAQVPKVKMVREVEKVVWKCPTLLRDA